MKPLSALTLLLVILSGCDFGGPTLASARSHLSSEQKALGEPIVNSVGMILAPIPAGEFLIGSAPAKEGKEAMDRGAERPQHRVRITRSFHVGVCEVTQSQYEAVMSVQPWRDQPLVSEADDSPATYVTWKDAVEFCRKLSDLEREEYRLPTEAEWEYACRAGTTSTFSFGEDGSKLSDHAWYDANAYQAGRQCAQLVGRKRPNPWGLYDMHGNVWEWCQDWYAPYDGKQTRVDDPSGPRKGSHHVSRGGSFADAMENARSATRLSFGRVDYRPEYLTGFRVVRTIKERK